MAPSVGPPAVWSSQPQGSLAESRRRLVLVKIEGSLAPILIIDPCGAANNRSKNSSVSYLPNLLPAD